MAEALRVLLHLLHLLVRVVTDLAAHALLLLDEVLEGLHGGVELGRDGTLLAVGPVRLVLLTAGRFARLAAQQSPGVSISSQTAHCGRGGGGCGSEPTKGRRGGRGGGGASEASQCWSHAGGGCRSSKPTKGWSCC